MKTLSFTPIGVFRCEKKQPFEAASQGHLDLSSDVGCIELRGGQNFEQALTGLAEMSHVWVVFAFHQNENWKPLVQVPRGSDQKQGVFATRSPYRPNPIGLSLVEIERIEGRKIWVRHFDLLDETPVLDLKPYHPEADAPLQEPTLGWMQNLAQDEYQVSESTFFGEQVTWLSQKGVTQIAVFCKQQLRFDPLNADKKRVRHLSDSEAVLAYRTWRVTFRVNERNITLEQISSGYTDEDLATDHDKWNDKDLHRSFISRFR